MMVATRDGTYWHTVARYVRLARALEPALEALHAAGVPTIVLKGMALVAAGAWPPGERPMADVDLLIRPEGKERAVSVLVGLGFTPLPEPEGSALFPTDRTGELICVRGAGAMATVLELHWHLCNVEWVRRLTAVDEEALWEAARPLVVEGAVALQLGATDALLHLCLHLAQHAFAHPIGYRDIDRFLRHEPGFPWDRFVARAEQFRLRTAAFFPLQVAAEALGVPVPEGVLTAMRPSARRRWLVRQVADPRRALSRPVASARAREYVVHFLIADRLRDVFRVLLWLVFPGWSWLAERYCARNRLHTLLCALFHPLRVVWEGTRAVALLLVGGGRRC